MILHAEQPGILKHYSDALADLLADLMAACSRAMPAANANLSQFSKATAWEFPPPRQLVSLLQWNMFHNEKLRQPTQHLLFPPRTLL